MPKSTSDTLQKDPITQVGAKIELDAEAIKRRVDDVLGQALYWFPVRHHSPAVALYLEQIIRSRKPKYIFLEGPWEANHLIPYVVDAKTKPPVAIYSSYRDDDNVLGLAGIFSPSENIPARFASWYPLLSYSPEYVAITTAANIGSTVVFIDLPHQAEIKPLSALTGGQCDDENLDEECEDHHHDEEGDDDGQDEEMNDDAAAQASTDKADKTEKKPELEESSSERLIVESGFFQTLAEVAGYRSFNEAWDTLFEIRKFDGGVEEFRRELAVFCAAARATSHPQRIASDGTLERERFMKKTIKETMAEKNLKPEDCMVVCGGFHLFLDAEDETPPPEIPAGTVYVTVVPMSFFRVSELSGYGAGNRAPQFYQTFWDLTKGNRAREVVIEHVVNVLKQGRKSGEPLSSADAIAVCQNAELLARLRGRPAPVLDDIEDALITCCCKGNPVEEGAHLLKAIDTANIGNRLGRVTPDLGQLPIVSDFYAQLDSLDLGELMAAEKRLSLDLDKRVELAGKQSVFLHRVLYLGVPVGGLVEAPSADFATGKLFREKWVLKWSPAIESTLIEKNLYGDTIESAALSRLREDVAADQSHAGRASQRLVNAINMDLPNLVHEVEEALGKAVDSDTRFVSLTQALNNMLVIDKFAVYRNLRRALLEDLIVRSYDRCCFSILDIVAVPENQQQDVISALLGLAEVTMHGDKLNLDRALFIEHVRHAAAATQVPFLRGAFLGLMTELREMTTQELAGEVSALSRAPVDIMTTAGDFLDGIMCTSRTSIMLGADALTAAIDELLRAAEWDPFLTMLPRMRAAFERLHDRQVDSVASRVAMRYGLKDGDDLLELRTSVGAAARIAEIDRRVAEIMKDWEF